MKKYQKVIILLTIILINIFTLYFTIATFSLLSSVMFLAVLMSSTYLVFPYLHWQLIVESVAYLGIVCAIIASLAAIYHGIAHINLHMQAKGFRIFRFIGEYLTKF